eukprot:GEMP01089369.1.p1 GENE.GEMP01089369.1~~GEMP01089369.1.p1  ORF type:complete len:220 (+),score=38.11 GEMP01089369.1:62-661(+)
MRLGGLLLVCVLQPCFSICFFSCVSVNGSYDLCIKFPPSPLSVFVQQKNMNRLHSHIAASSTQPHISLLDRFPLHWPAAPLHEVHPLDSALFRGHPIRTKGPNISRIDILHAPAHEKRAVIPHRARKHIREIVYWKDWDPDPQDFFQTQQAHYEAPQPEHKVHDTAAHGGAPAPGLTAQQQAAAGRVAKELGSAEDKFL